MSHKGFCSKKCAHDTKNAAIAAKALAKFRETDPAPNYTWVALAGRSLDNVGLMYNLFRRKKESDKDFRQRIRNHFGL